jgi:hypothetical protein
LYDTEPENRALGVDNLDILKQKVGTPAEPTPGKDDSEMTNPKDADSAEAKPSKANPTEATPRKAKPEEATEQVRKPAVSSLQSL